MKTNCSKCGKSISVKPSKIKAQNYCDKVCASKLESKPCTTCGKTVTRVRSQMRQNAFCDRACAAVWTSARMTELNPVWNKDRMTEPVRAKLRAARLGKGSGFSYEKFFGRHTHRVVAERIAGRPLKPGEVVHHKNGLKRDNTPTNLHIFPSQADHARWHKLNP